MTEILTVSLGCHKQILSMSSVAMTPNRWSKVQGQALMTVKKNKSIFQGFVLSHIKVSIQISVLGN
jgi:hypothetical protein